MYSMVWEFVPVPCYETQQIHSIVGFDKKALKHNTNLPFLNKAPLNPLLPDPVTGDYPCVYDGEIVFLSSIPIHPLLHVCQESRTVTIKRYSLLYAFGTYINFDHDIIFCDGSLAIYPGEHSRPGIASLVQILVNTSSMLSTTDANM